MGVRFALDNPQATPEMMHQNWMKTHLDTGWTYGELKDEGLKTHPCLVEYDQLPRGSAGEGHLRTGGLDLPNS